MTDDQGLTAVADAVDGLKIDGPGVPDAEPVIPDEDLPPAAAAQPGLFPTSEYLDVPTVEGQATDKLTIAFGGSISYDAADPQGRALFDALTGGKEVELRVAGLVATKQGAWKENARGELIVTGKAGVKVHTIWVLKPEDLG
jgi:hypothetical protein